MEHSTKKIVKNTLLFTGAMLAQKIVSFANFLYISAKLAPDTLGGYVWALSFTTMFSIGADLGLSFIMMRDSAKENQSEEKYLQNVMGIKIPMIILTLAATLGVLFATKHDAETIGLVLAATVLMVCDALSVVFYSFLRAKQMLSYESIGVIGFQIVSFIGSVFAIELGGGVFWVMATLTLAGIVNVFYALYVFKKKFNYSLRPRYDKDTFRYFLRLMPAFALSGIFVRIYNASDSVILGYMKGNAAVGLFSIPAKAVTAFQALIPGAFTATIYPSMSNFYATSHEKLEKLFEKSFNYLSLVSVPIALGLYIVAEPAMKLIWPKYMAAVPTFQIMALALPFVFLAFPTGLLLRACDKQNINTMNRGIIMVLSVVLNIILVYYYGVFGAGVTFLIVNVVLLVADMIYVGKIINCHAKHMLIYNLKVLLAGGVMAFSAWIGLQYVNFYAAIILSAILFAVMVFLLGVISHEEFSFLKTL
jgi:O-antigen/teichoic acid export membrane protein